MVLSFPTGILMSTKSDPIQRSAGWREALMDRKTKWVAGGALSLALIGGTGFAVASGAGDDTPLTGSNLERATAAALAYTGGGTVTETEVGDGSAAYSVEVRLDDGSQVEVNLDQDFNVIGQSGDEDGPNDQDGSNDD
jgi:hypothetical protein